MTRALILTPTRELAAQIDAHPPELAVHTTLTGAAVRAERSLRRWKRFREFIGRHPSERLRGEEQRIPLPLVQRLCVAEMDRDGVRCVLG